MRDGVGSGKVEETAGERLARLERLRIAAGLGDGISAASPNLRDRAGSKVAETAGERLARLRLEAGLGEGISAASPWERRWYALAVQSQATTRERLAERDWEVFDPRVVERIGHPRRGVSEREGPLFPGYLFVHTPPAQTEWHRLNREPGVLGIVRAGENPIPAQPGKIEDLIRLALIEGDGTVWIDDTDKLKPEVRPGPLPGKRDRNRPPPFKVDQLLQIDAGPFTSFQGLYVEGEGDRLKLWVDIFGRQVLHEISEALVRPV